jgi:hypothetical protein
VLDCILFRHPSKTHILEMDMSTETAYPIPNRPTSNPHLPLRLRHATSCNDTQSDSPSSPRDGQSLDPPAPICVKTVSKDSGLAGPLPSQAHVRFTSKAGGTGIVEEPIASRLTQIISELKTFPAAHYLVCLIDPVYPMFWPGRLCGVEIP